MFDQLGEPGRPERQRVEDRIRDNTNQAAERLAREGVALGSMDDLFFDADRQISSWRSQNSKQLAWAREVLERGRISGIINRADYQRSISEVESHPNFRSSDPEDQGV